LDLRVTTPVGAFVKFKSPPVIAAEISERPSQKLSLRRGGGFFLPFLLCADALAALVRALS